MEASVIDLKEADMLGREMQLEVKDEIDQVEIQSDLVDMETVRPWMSPLTAEVLKSRFVKENLMFLQLY